MRKLRIYLDTSVISYLMQEDVPEKMAETLEFWEILKSRDDVSIIISELVVREINQCYESKLSYMLNKMNEIEYLIVPITREDSELADLYLKNGVLKEKSLDDLIHIAVATLNQCKYIVSWNFKHFVNPKTIREVNAINDAVNLNQVSIYPPSMMLGGF